MSRNCFSLILWDEKRRSIEDAYGSYNNPYNNFNYAASYSQLLVPDLGLILMFLILAISRPHLNNQELHSLCRVLFSLALAFDLVYYSVLRINAYVQSFKVTTGMAGEDGTTDDDTFEKVYFCSIDYGYYGNSLRQCRTLTSRHDVHPRWAHGRP